MKNHVPAIVLIAFLCAVGVGDLSTAFAAELDEEFTEGYAEGYEVSSGNDTIDMDAKPTCSPPPEPPVSLSGLGTFYKPFIVTTVGIESKTRFAVGYSKDSSSNPLAMSGFDYTYSTNWWESYEWSRAKCRYVQLKKSLHQVEEETTFSHVSGDLIQYRHVTTGLDTTYDNNGQLVSFHEHKSLNEKKTIWRDVVTRKTIISEEQSTDSIIHHINNLEIKSKSGYHRDYEYDDDYNLEGYLETIWAGEPAMPKVIWVPLEKLMTFTE